MAKQKLIKFENSYLAFIYTYLSSLSLDVKLSSARRRFVRDIKVFLQDLEEEQKALREKYADKDEKGDPVIKDNQYVVKNENVKKLRTDMETLMKEENTLEVSQANEKDIKAMKKLLEDEATKFEKEKKGKFSADDFELLETLREFAILLEAK